MRLYGQFPVTEYSITPRSTDPAIQEWNDPHYVVLARGQATQKKLFLMLPGSNGTPGGYKLITQEAARFGYHAIGLMYANSFTVDALAGDSSDRDAFEKVRREIIDGTDRGNLVTVNRTNSIESRLIKLLQYLQAQQPSDGWGQYLDGDKIRWGQVVASGHSQGGGHAGTIGKMQSVARVVMFAAPQDYMSVYRAPADWLAKPGLTPSELYFSFMHVSDPGANQQRQARQRLGLPEAKLVDGLPVPYANARQLETAATPASTGAQAFHNSVAVDGSTPKLADLSPAFRPVWDYLLKFDNSIPATGWTLSYKAGSKDSNGAFLGGTEMRCLTVHKGKVYGGIETWMDSTTGTNDPAIGAQILVQDEANGPWRLDKHFDEKISGGNGRQDIRNEGVTALESITFQTDSTGKALAVPVTKLITACRDFLGISSVYVRDDFTGAWLEDRIANTPATDKATIRSLSLYRDRVTGVDMVFAGALPTGIFSGVYDPARPSQIRWNPNPELVGFVGRPMAFAVANGALHVAIAPKVYRRVDGPNPRWEEVFSYDLNVTPGGSSGLRGLTAIPNPNGRGESLLAALEGNRGQMVRLDPGPQLPYRASMELDIIKQLSDTWGYPASYVVVANSDMTWVRDPQSGERVLFITIQHHPAKARNDAYYYIRRGNGSRITYELRRIDNLAVGPNVVLNSTRAIALSPYSSDNGQAIYFGGYDADDNPSHNTAYVLKTNLAMAFGQTALMSISVSGAAGYRSDVLAPDSIVSLFGSGLANSTVSATSNILPQEVAGRSVRVTDAEGRVQSAGIYFVSPGQINFLMPASLSAGKARVDLFGSGGMIASAEITLSPVAPGLFTADGSVNGSPSAVLVRAPLQGPQSSTVLNGPIRFGPIGEQMALVIYGSGWRRASGLSAVSARVGTTNVTVQFAGAQGEYPGLDQMNLVLPRSLAGSANQVLSISVDGVPANSVALMFP